MIADDCAHVHELLMAPRDLDADDFRAIVKACNWPGSKGNRHPWVKELEAPEYVAARVFDVSISEARRRGCTLIGPFACPHFDKWWVVKMGRKDRHPVFLFDPIPGIEDDQYEYS